MTTKLSQVPLATVADLAAAWREISIDEQERAAALLLQASNYLRLVANNNGQSVDDNIAADPTGVYGENVKAAVIACVQRALSKPASMAPDVTQYSQSASPYSEAMSFGGDASGSLYYKDRELKLLGLGAVSGAQKIGILRGVCG